MTMMPRKILNSNSARDDSAGAGSLPRRGAISWCVLIIVWLVLGLGPHRALADTIVLLDGTIVEGKIVKETSKYVKIETEAGTKTYRRKKISEITKENIEGSALHAIETTASFADLPEMARQLKNAEALYSLGRYDEIPEFVEPLIGKGASFDEMRIRWLLIETYERQGKWDKVQTLLDKTLEDGREPDKIRANAHKDIFEQNPGYTLRRVGDKRTADFLEREQRNRGKMPNALQDPELMRAALLEYIHQILANEKLSIYRFKQNLDVDESLEAIAEQIENGSKTVVKALPYTAEMERVQRTLYRANAILPGYADIYDLELVRIEAEHLAEIIDHLAERALDAYPENGTYPSEPDSGRLTPEGREAWRKACDDFLKLCEPLLEINEFLLSRVRRYPKKLRAFIKIYEDVQERLEQMRNSTVRNRDRVYL